MDTLGTRGRISNKWFALFLVLVMAISFFTVLPRAEAVNMIEFDGFLNDDGQPIPDAQIQIQVQVTRGRYRTRWEKLPMARSDQEGRFTLKLEEDKSHLVIVSHRNEVTGEYDYVPYGVYMTPKNEGSKLDIELDKCGYINVIGQAYLIESTAIPTTSIKVLDEVSGDAINSGSVPIIFGSSGVFSDNLNIPRDTVLVPCDQEFVLEVTSNIKIGKRVMSHELVINEFEEGVPSGEHVEIDLRKYVLPNSLIEVRNTTDATSKLILEKEEEGFFLAVERQRLSGVIRLTDEAESWIVSGSYDIAFTRLREAYLELSDVRRLLSGMINDATQSVYLLVSFMAITATIISSIVYDDNLRKIGLSSIIYMVLLVAFYMLHPGSGLITTSEFLKIGVFSFCAVSALGFLTPSFLSEGGENTSLRNVAVPILSVAKRGLRRRWLRFGLTLTTVLLLVASFISLTSFSSGYGLSLKIITNQPLSSMGILLRTPNPPPEKAAAPFCGGNGVSGPAPLEHELIKWLEETEDPDQLISKYVNHPQRQYRESNTPFARLEGKPIFGVMAINPSLEVEVNQLDKILAQGEFLTNDEQDTVIISEKLAASLGKAVGDTVRLTAQEKTLNLLIVGLFNDKALEDIKDLDGQSILPQKIIEWERIEFDGPDHVVEALAYCDADEVVLINQVTGANMSGLWLNRVIMTFEEELDLREYAEKTALNRGLRVWASTPEGIVFAQLAGYFEGKGFPILVPWIIVVLNVIITMLNSYYERRHEVMIYSSIGMNPHHISGIFLSEAGVIGIVGGCGGYILGLAAYKLIYILTPTLQVAQKVSAFWSIAAVGISMAAVMIGGMVALRNSTAITPSLRRRWKADMDYDSEAFNLELPIHIPEDEIDVYLNFLYGQLKRKQKISGLTTRNVKITQPAEKKWVINFIYGSADPTISAIYTRNKLSIEKVTDGTYHTSLDSVADSTGIQAVGSYLRRISLDWSLMKSEKEYKENQ